MTAELVRILGGWLDGTDITLLELTTSDGSLRLVQPPRTDRQGCVPAAEAMQLPETPGDPSPSSTVGSPGAGVFLDRHPMRDEMLAPPGREVCAGDVVGLLQVGALLLHVVAPADGRVVRVLAASGSMVGYGTPLLCLQRRGQP